MLPSPLLCLLLLLQALPPRSPAPPHGLTNGKMSSAETSQLFSDSLICSICAQPRRCCGRPWPALPRLTSRTMSRLSFPGQAAQQVEVALPQQPGHALVVSPVPSVHCPSSLAMLWWCHLSPLCTVPAAWPRPGGVTCPLRAWGCHCLGRVRVPQAEVVQGTPSPEQVPACCLLSFTGQRGQFGLFLFLFVLPCVFSLLQG